jgi:hypothetical protein
MAIARATLIGFPEAGFDLAEISFPRVDSAGCVLVKTNAYSVPVRAGTPVHAKLYPAHLRSGTTASWWPDMNAATDDDNRSLTSSAYFH